MKKLLNNMLYILDRTNKENVNYRIFIDKIKDYINSLENINNFNDRYFGNIIPSNFINFVITIKII